MGVTDQALVDRRAFPSSEVGRKWEATGGDEGKFVDQVAGNLSDTDYILTLLESPHEP